MFLALEEWRHPSRAVQEMARPATVWNCFSIVGVQPSFLIEIKHVDEDGDVHHEWLVAAKLETLVPYLEEGPQRVGEVRAMVPGHLHHMRTWQLEKVLAVRAWSVGEQVGLEYQLADQQWYAASTRPSGATDANTWSLSHQ